MILRLVDDSKTVLSGRYIFRFINRVSKEESSIFAGDYSAYPLKYSLFKLNVDLSAGEYLVDVFQTFNNAPAEGEELDLTGKKHIQRTFIEVTEEAPEDTILESGDNNYTIFK